LGSDFLTIVLFSIFLLCILGGGAILIWLYRLNSQKQLKSRVDNFVESKATNAEQFSRVLSGQAGIQHARFEGVRGKLNNALNIFTTNELRIKIASAYWPISEIEFIFLRIAIVLVGLFLGWTISGSIIGGLGLGVFLYFIPGIVLDRTIAKRRSKFQDQLVDYFVLVKGAVLVGSSLPQALELAAKEIPAPISEEFTQVLREMRLGIPLEEALQNLLVRMESDDLQIIVTAIILNSQMGGSISTILEATIDTIRDRLRLFREVRSLTAYSRYVGTLMSILPLLLALLIYLSNPGYFDTVKNSSLTQMILLVALFGIIIGNIFLRRIMKIRI
jgi:tight adherence protein B